MKPIELPILYYSEASEQLKLLGVDTTYTHYEIRNMTFYRIDAVGVHYDEKDNNREYSEIFCGGESFVCKYHYIKLLSKLEENDK